MNNKQLNLNSSNKRPAPTLEATVRRNAAAAAILKGLLGTQPEASYV